jgi:hypothetical protein
MLRRWGAMPGRLDKEGRKEGAREAIHDFSCVPAFLIEFELHHDENRE